MTDKKEQILPEEQKPEEEQEISEKDLEQVTGGSFSWGATPDIKFDGKILSTNLKINPAEINQGKL